jgi:hypothetical protein
MVKVGFDWTSLIVTLLPVVIEMISTCFNKSSDLQAFAEGNRNPLQMAGLRNKCRRVVQEHGVRGPFRIAAAAKSLQQAILQEVDAQAQLAAGPDVYEAAFQEALSV